MPRGQILSCSYGTGESIRSWATIPLCVSGILSPAVWGVCVCVCVCVCVHTCTRALTYTHPYTQCTNLFSHISIFSIQPEVIILYIITVSLSSPMGNIPNVYPTTKKRTMSRDHILVISGSPGNSHLLWFVVILSLYSANAETMKGRKRLLYVKCCHMLNVNIDIFGTDTDTNNTMNKIDN